MNRHTQELYRLAELPAFIEEALSNVSLKNVIAAYAGGSNWNLIQAIDEAIHGYAETWVDEWMAGYQSNMWEDHEDSVDLELMAIKDGVALFSNPDCKAGLPE